MLRITNALLIAVFALLIASCAITSYDPLHESIAEKAAYDAGMARPEESCEHGFKKTYYFVMTDEGKVRNPYTKWDCLSLSSTEEVLAKQKEYLAQSGVDI